MYTCNLQCILIVYFIAITNRAICRTPLHISMGLLVVESVQLCIQVWILIIIEMDKFPKNGPSDELLVVNLYSTCFELT
jgi:hypothetical protein